MILMIDNYDSFSYNLVQYIGSINEDIKIIRNDEYTVKEILEMDISHIVISPGPGCPSEAGIIEELIRNNTKIPMLGICLGHQAICEAFGAKIEKAPVIVHGKADIIKVNNDPLFKGFDGFITAARYHSLVAVEIPKCLEVIAFKDDLVMGVKHKEYPIYGLQFHPESVLTRNGILLIKNFLEG